MMGRNFQIKKHCIWKVQDKFYISHFYSATAARRSAQHYGGTERYVQIPINENEHYINNQRTSYKHYINSA